MGVAAVTAGPGVWNAVGGLASAAHNGSPVVVLGGRAPSATWGLGALQEVDHVPVVAPLAKHAATVTERIAGHVAQAIGQALAPPRGPVFLDFPADLPAADDDGDGGDGGDGEPGPLQAGPPVISPDPDAVQALLAALRRAARPVLVAGSNVYLDGAWEAMQAFAEAARLPVFTNGMGRGTIPADHPLAFARARQTAMAEADLVIVAGTPIDFRLSFGWRFAHDAVVAHLDSHPDLVGLAGEPRHVPAGARRPGIRLGADLRLTFAALAEARRDL